MPGGQVFKFFSYIFLAVFSVVPLILTYLSAGHESASNLGALIAGTIGFSLMTANMILATRPVILEQWAGGLDRVYELHKWIGAGIAAAVLLHSQIGFEQVSGVLPPGSIGETAAEVGELVLWPFVVLLMLSLIKRIPRLPFEIPYNLWRWSHRLMGVVFVALAFHQLFVKAPFGPTDLISQWMIVMALVGTLAFLWTQLGARFRTRRYSVAEVEHLPGATRVRAEPAGRGIRPRAG